MVTLEEIKRDEEINACIRHADSSMRALGYTEHGFAHVTLVAERAAYLLSALGYPAREVELVRIAGYLHDIGNLVNRIGHSQSGALLAFRLLRERGMSADETASVVTAIGNHDEGSGVPVSDLAAALILADKSDVRRSRVREASNPDRFDIHDRVNYSVTKSDLTVDKEKRTVTLALDIDTEYAAVMEYFQIFMERMTLCRQAAQELDARFRLIINGQVLV